MLASRPPIHSPLLATYLSGIIVSGFRVMQYERNRAEDAEQVVRDHRRAEEMKNVNVPRGFRVAALAFQAQAHIRITAQSDDDLGRMIDHAITNMNADTLCIIRREMLAERFGPFDDLKRGRYGRLKWADARAENVKLQELGLVVKADSPEGGFRWTAFGYAVIGKLAPKLCSRGLLASGRLYRET